LTFQPFAFVSQIFCMILLSKSTVLWHVTESLRVISKRRRWIPHRLSYVEKEARVEKSEELLQLLLSMKHQSWKYIVTFDEAWFYFCADYETIWLTTREPKPDRERRIVSSPN
jgi:hypothetical protein